MKKTVIKSVLAATSLLAVAGVANAQEINIYGSSDQFNLWKTAAAGFLASTGPAQCSNVTAFTKDSSGKHGIITGAGCTGSFLAGDTTLTIRVSSKASYDGIFAVTGSTDAKATLNCGTDAYSRQLADWTDGTMTAVKVGSTTCHTITLGASDIRADTFFQSSTGQLLGPRYGGATTRSFPSTGIDVSSLTTPVYQPVKVPFAFFVTNNVTARTCVSGPAIGDYCNADINCGKVGGSVVAGSCSAASAPITNISREMATQIFGGNISNWASFAGFDSKPLVVCYQHAGSGAHATLDLAVMNKGWGKGLPTAERTSTRGPASLLYFNDGAGDVMNCLDIELYFGNGAIGYAAADADPTAGDSFTITAGHINGPLRYNGSYPNAQNIITGMYDFFADQSLYLANSAVTGLKPTVDSLTAYINDGTNLAAPGFGDFWAGSSEMKVTRSGNPFTYPAGVAGR